MSQEVTSSKSYKRSTDRDGREWHQEDPFEYWTVMLTDSAVTAWTDKVIEVRKKSKVE